MRLCLIYNVWDDYDLLSHSIRNMRKLVDGIIVVASTKSNYGEYSPIPDEFKNDELHVREPRFHIPMHSETDKRNFGIDIARQQGYTHFVMMDADEVYKEDEFQRYKYHMRVFPDVKGLVCLCQTFFKSPTLTIGFDITLVPFIHELTPTIKCEFNRSYPFAWEGKQIRIDPTRSYNINSGVEKVDVTMFHFSWVRKDIEIKIRNSSARTNLEHSSIREDYANAAPGVYNRFYQKTLVECENIFNLPEF